MNPCIFRCELVPVDAVSLHRPLRSQTGSTFYNIHPVGHGFHMCRIHTVTYTTKMINDQTRRNLGYQLLIGNPVRVTVPAIPAVSTPVDVSGPQPTITGLVDKAPERNTAKPHLSHSPRT